MSKKRIAVIAGDGIGKEVMPEGIRVVDAAARKFNIDLAWEHFDFGCWEYCEKHGKYLPDDWKERIGGHDAIYFGAVGWPEKVPDHSIVSLRIPCTLQKEDTAGSPATDT